jgi:hypothetical protein
LRPISGKRGDRKQSDGAGQTQSWIDFHVLSSATS